MMEEDEDTTLNSESDETVTLSEIVAGRDVTLREEELWALCRECCLTLEFVHSTQELFQSLVITPETVAFDREGNVCFLDLDADPEPLYIPPEYEEDGCSYKSHLFSLGMTLLFAVEYSNIAQDEDSKPALSQDIRDLLTHLTQDSPDNRPDLELVLEYCDRALLDTSSQDICQRFACVPSEEEPPKEGGTSLLSMTEELAAYLNNQNGLVTPGQQQHSNSISDTDSSKQASSHRQQALDAQIQAGLPGQIAEDVKPSSGSHERKDTVPASAVSPSMEHSQNSAGDDSSLASPRKNRRRQGLLLSEILTALDRTLQEPELWALCRECIISLQRKRKHLPAYISLDTVMIREVGCVSFKAIPEDKPLEVIYMAPELQQKGILNEKTCMYGLGVTLKCAAGYKCGSTDIDNKVGPAFLELVTTLLEVNPDLRPSLEVCLMACDEFEKQSSIDSRLQCQEVYMDACALTSSREPKRSEMPAADAEDTSLAVATELQTSWTELEDTEREGVFLEDEPEEEAASAEHKAQGFQPVTATHHSASSGSAFKPVPFKPKAGKLADLGDKSSQPCYPSAFSSPATHFKPIVVTQAGLSGDGNSGDQDDDKEKNVVQKLREIKKNLLKHRPPGNLSTDVEVDDSKPPVAEKTRTPRTNTSGRSSRKSSGSGESGGVLENLLQQLQNSGQMPDTQNLALAIAQHLQSKLGMPAESEGEGTKPPQVSAESNSAKTSDSSQLSVVTTQASVVETPLENSAAASSQSDTSGTQAVPAAQVSQPQVAGSLPVPQFGGQFTGMSQAGYMPQPMPMPMVPFPGGVMPGSVQYHLQQDPRTGLIHLVPVPVMSYGPQSGPSLSPHTPGIEHGGNPWQQPMTVSPGAGLAPDFAKDNDDSVHRHSVRPNVNSRNARGLIQKTANQRAKNAASASTSPTGYLSDNGASYTNVQHEGSVVHDHCGVPQRDGSLHRRSRSSGALVVGESGDASVMLGDTLNQKQDNVMALPPKDTTGPRGKKPVNKTHELLQSSSQSSSPSPSKDSGICLTHGQASSVSLMERLLSSESLRHQQAVTQVLHILNQSFGDQGPDGFQKEEMLAEYIVSLAHLKWETFIRAVTEKYPQLFWSHTLLVNLYHTINKQTSVASKSSSKAQQGSENKRMGFESHDVISHPHDFWTAESRRKPSFREGENGEEPPSSSTETRRHHSDSGNKQRTKGDRGSPTAGGEEPQSVVRVLANGRYISETSDSTDNEQEEKRRRFKKRYELDRNKSASLHSLPATAKFSVPPERRINVQQGVDPRHTLHGHTEVSQAAQGVYDVRMAKPYAERRDEDVRGAGWNVHDDSHSSKMSSLSPSHSLPRNSKSSQPQHPQNSRHDSRSVVSPSSVHIPHAGASGHGSSSAAKDNHIYSSRPSRSHSGAISQSESPHQHLYSSASMADSHKLQRPDSRDSHGPFRDSPGQHSQNLTNLNNSIGSSSYSPSFGQNSKDNSAGNHHSELNHPALSPQLDSQGFVYGQLREPLGKPPSSASPQVTRTLRNAQSPPQRDSNNSKSPVPRQTSPSQSEVNNNAVKQRGVGRESRGGCNGSSRNRDRSPVRKTQHKVKPQLAWDQEIAEYRKKGQVVYHSAMIQLSMTPEMNRFIHSIDEGNKAAITSKLSSVEQEMSMLRKQRRKSQAFYKRLSDPGVKHAKGENKSVIGQVLKDMSEMTCKLRYLDLCRTHLQMLLAELYGLDTCYVTALASSGGGGRSEEDMQPLVLQPYSDNQWLQFQTVREPAAGCEVQLLQAGHPQGLLAYLFTVSALSDGYIHQFLFCFRYFLRAEEVFTFITQKYVSAHRGSQSDVNIVRTQQRALDLLQFWVEGYYSLDFERNDALLDRLEAFVMQRVEENAEGSQNLMNLLYACHLGENSELIRQADDAEDLDEVYYLHLAAPKRQTQTEQLMEWESFRSLIGRKKSESLSKASKKDGQAAPYKEKGGVLVEKRPPSRAEDGSTSSLARRTDITQLMDYAPHRLAEQLTLMEQELFQRTHPVHYLDSKSQGVGVDLSIPSLRTPSMTRKAKPESQSLFVGATLFEPRISDLIAHGQEIMHWVSAEILSCGSQKSQVGALTKFLQTAQLCVEIRNYATALAITAGLDNLIVRQLPAWKHLPAKIATLMDDLEALQMKIKGEPMALMQTKESHIYPTIPCTLFFLLHLQQLEIGGFTLANGMFKWQKMRTISQMIDQIRIFREHEYGFEPDYELQSLICRRLHELSDRDLHSVAAAHDNNFRRVVSHAAGIQGTWRKVKVKLQTRTK